MGNFKKSSAVLEALHVEDDGTCIFILPQVFQVVGGFQVSLITDTDKLAQSVTLLTGYFSKQAPEGSALGDKGNLTTPGSGTKAEIQTNSRAVYTHAVGTNEPDTPLPGDFFHLILKSFAFVSGFCEAGCNQNHTLDSLCRTICHCSGYKGGGNHNHRHVNFTGNVTCTGVGRKTEHLFFLRVNRIYRSPIAGHQGGGYHAVPPFAGGVRSPDNGYGTCLKNRVQLLGDSF